MRCALILLLLVCPAACGHTASSPGTETSTVGGRSNQDGGAGTAGAGTTSAAGTTATPTGGTGEIATTPTGGTPSSGCTTATGAGAGSPSRTGPTAENGVPLPVRDPRNSCAGLGVETRFYGEPGSCAPISCPCPDSPPGSQRCITAVDCDALCALKDEGFERLYRCTLSDLCRLDEDCKPGERCVQATGETKGFCSTQAVEQPCSSAADCASHACVVDWQAGTARCYGTDVGDPCNLDEHCASGRCVLGDGRWVGNCGDGQLGSPCFLPKDCFGSLKCAADQLHLCEQWPGSCTDGLVGSPCHTAGDCVPGIACVESIQRCTNGAVGSPCRSLNDCKSPFCVDSMCSSGKPNSPCKFDLDCDGGSCVWATRLCSDGAVGHSCDDTHACRAPLVCDQFTCKLP